MIDDSGLRPDELVFGPPPLPQRCYGGDLVPATDAIVKLAQSCPKQPSKKRNKVQVTTIIVVQGLASIQSRRRQSIG